MTYATLRSIVHQLEVIMHRGWTRFAGPALAVGVAVLAAGCAAGDATLFGPATLAGFWDGLWHGVISGVAFFISLFDDTVRVYEIHNEGTWYDFGFMLGVTAIWGGMSGGASGRKLRKAAADVKKLGQYNLEKKLGEGGMGVVYRASHAMLRRATAVKLLSPDKASEKAIARFEREVRLTARLTHPNTVTIFDYGRTPDDVFYYAMELLDGATLEDIVEVAGPQPAARVRKVLFEAASALTEAHAIGLIHRDIKPANIMLCTQGGVSDVTKLLDFGLVKEVDQGTEPDLGLSRADTLLGTPLYMAPEAIANPLDVGPPCDLYALGAVGYYLLTGEHVFSGASVMEVCVQHVNNPPVPPSERLGQPVPQDLEQLLLACLAKEPADRPSSAKELCQRLEACDVGSWDGAWWWEEYGPALEEGVTTESVDSSLTVSIDLERRRTPPD